MQVFLKLIDQADVFLNNMSIEAPKRWGSARRADETKPRLIYAQASGWGRKVTMRKCYHSITRG
jgi:crotonobetainyl-CoA:carnitine CoA-transferase CaiB-like acyl-CoA transferase